MSPGAPKGNKNALKDGRYTAEAVAWPKRHFEPAAAHERSSARRQMNGNTRGAESGHVADAPRGSRLPEDLCGFRILVVLGGLYERPL